MESDGASSSTITASPVPSARVALLGEARASANVSLPSAAASPSTLTATVPLVTPAANETVPEAAV